MINTNKQNSKFNNSGFTLLEILVALALFSLVISMVVGIFVSGSGSQRKIIELYTVQREAGYIMETVSRELRMATAIADSNNIGPIPPYSEDQQNNDDHTIEFTNYEDKLVEYCRSDDTGTCSGIGLYIAKNIKNSSGGYVSKNVISSSDVTIEDLKFYTSEDFNLTQPLITIVLKVKSTGKYGTSVILQDSISLRIYN